MGCGVLVDTHNLAQLGARLPAGLPKARDSSQGLSRCADHGLDSDGEHGESISLFVLTRRLLVSLRFRRGSQLLCQARLAKSNGSLPTTI